jgi:hypothetical protein
MLAIGQSGQKRNIISSCTEPNSTMVAPIFHKRLSIEIKLEKRKKLVSLPSKS